MRGHVRPNAGRTHARHVSADQQNTAFVLMQRYDAYAEWIGCTFGTGPHSDEIVATEAQGALLDKWWKDNA